MPGEPLDKENRSYSTSVRRSPYDVFQVAIAAGIKQTVTDCWPNFAYWETARNFADDPSHPAKAAIEWVYAMEDLRAALDEFEGGTKKDCFAALDQSYEAFAKLEHSDELIDGIEKWIECRLGQ